MWLAKAAAAAIAAVQVRSVRRFRNGGKRGADGCGEHRPHGLGTCGLQAL
jgi:hypothetical protein